LSISPRIILLSGRHAIVGKGEVAATSESGKTMARINAKRRRICLAPQVPSNLRWTSARVL